MRAYAPSTQSESPRRALSLCSSKLACTTDLHGHAAGLKLHSNWSFSALLLHVRLCETVAGHLQHNVCRHADDSANAAADGEGAEGDPVARSRPAKEPKHNTSPSATLESSLEALNVKKFDLTFAMDPLFRRTSAQFDEGGAKGDLLSCLLVSGPAIYKLRAESPKRSLLSV